MGPTPLIRIPAGLVVLVGPPASGKTSFVRALVERGRIEAAAVVSSDEIRAELFHASSEPGDSDAADARIFEERDRRITARLATGHTVIAESTNVTPGERARRGEPTGTASLSRSGTRARRSERARTSYSPSAARTAARRRRASALHP
ncbi:AAA family ATPase [Streptomyces sp. DH8]|uniref:AAA family ATPase n=1 Tax=Streptomyces sp. DH8 TaxID=2857008 RepID=UPI001E4A2FEE|nr:AAA family ATPase [Streptomyces sp. DH8]